jgi:hypothetical protein
MVRRWSLNGIEDMREKVGWALLRMDRVERRRGRRGCRRS